MHKYKLRGQKFGVAKANSQKLEVVLTKATRTSLKQLFYTYQFFDVSSITSQPQQLDKVRSVLPGLWLRLPTPGSLRKG